MTPTGNPTPKLMAALALGAAFAPVAAPTPANAGPARAIHRLVILDQSHAVFASPDGRRLGRVRERRPITEVRTVLPLLGDRTGVDGREWLRVRLPGRPNGHSGWITSDSTRLGLTTWRLRVDTSRRRVRVYRSGRAVRTFRAVVGAPSTPTPRGRFFVEETVRLSPSRVGAPFALALSARSRVFQRFAGGPGQIALHGLGNVGGTPGTAASHGCLRLDRASISWLAARIGPGVPVTIVR
jgi:hypothetical protein